MAKTQKETEKMELERTLQARCLRYLRDKNIVFFKIISASPAGIPDLCILPKDSRAIFCEFKRKDGKLTALQSAQKARIEATNSARVFVVKDYKNFIEIVENLSDL